MHDVVIIGAGLAGLSCAAQGVADGLDVVLLEASDRPGGRLRTDIVDGFTLDHGFQVLLCAYPTCKQLLDYNALNLHSFDPGAVVRQRGGFSRLGDPWRQPQTFWQTLKSPVGSLLDKWKIGRLRSHACRGSLEELYLRPDVPTIDRLKEFGFGDKIIEDFFRPFLGGVFLESQLSTSSRMLEFVFRMFAQGPIAIPAAGMAAIPQQLASRLPAGCLQLEQTVERIADGEVWTTAGEVYRGKEIVIATESSAARRLTEPSHGAASELLDRGWQRTTCLYFAAPSAPLPDRSLVLRGDDRDGPVNHLAVISNVAPETAPPGQSLISITVKESPRAGEQEHQQHAVLQQMKRWFGEQVDRWQYLRTYHVPFALPVQDVGQLEPVLRSVEPFGTTGPIICGDHRETSSIEGALHSGLRAATVVKHRHRLRTAV